MKEICVQFWVSKKSEFIVNLSKERRMCYEQHYISVY